MSIQVKQLTINTSISSADNQSDDKKNGSGEEVAAQQEADQSCINVEEIKADIIAECQRLIKNSVETRRDR